MVNYLKHLDRLSDKTNIVILGRGELVGKPLVDILMNDKSLCGTVSVITSETSAEIAYNLIHNADVIVSAMGHSWNDNFLQALSPLATIVDCGIRVIKGKLSGDILKEYYPRISSRFIDYTPVPKGVGLLTRLTLLQHVWNYYKK